jgi:hypothetical protein
MQNGYILKIYSRIVMKESCSSTRKRRWGNAIESSSSSVSDHRDPNVVERIRVPVVPCSLGVL